MKKVISLLLMLLLVKVGALAFGIESTMNTIIDSWKGYSIDSVIERWGYPTEEKTIAGHKLYVWKTERIVTTDEYSTTKAHTDKKGRTYYTTTTSGGDTEIYRSERILEVDDNNIVIRGQYNGNDLPFTFVGIGKQWLNPAYRLNK